MSTQDNEQEIRIAAAVLVPIVVLVVGSVLGYGIYKARSGAGVSATVSVATESVDGVAPGGISAAASGTTSTASATPTASANDASVVVENGVVKFYFAVGKADLATGALVALDDAIDAAKNGKRLAISGFHDATGDPAFNAELAKQRAFAVRDALLGAGVAEASMELSKPEETTGTGNPAEARRVEVVIAD